MADNVNIKPSADVTAVPVAADDIGGVKYQRIKAGWGADGAYNDSDIASGKGMPGQNVAGSQADGHSATLGAVADAAYTSGSGSAISILKGLFGRLTQAAGDAIDAAAILATGKYVFNGTTWDRQRDGTGADGGTVGVPANAGMLWDGAAYRRVQSASSLSDGNSGSRVQAAAGYLWNGTTLDRARSKGTGWQGVAPVRSSDGAELFPVVSLGDGESGQAVGLQGSRLQGFNGTTWDRLRSKGTGWQGVAPVRSSDGAELFPLVTLGDGESGQAIGLHGARPQVYNGVTWDRQRGNTEGTLLASAARTATTATAVQTNYNARGVYVYLCISAASGTGGLTVQIQEVDPVTGNAFTTYSFALAAITAVSNVPFHLYPGLAAGNQSINAALPRTYYVRVTHADGSIYTYSLGYSLIV